MRVLFALTYYRPHISGLTIFVARLAEGLAARGHKVTVLASQHDADLPREEILDGVRVVRAPVVFLLSKGPVMSGYTKLARELLSEHELLVIHLPATPQESVLLPILTRFGACPPIIAVYYCELRLPEGVVNRSINEAMFAGNLVACASAQRVVTFTEDYARHSRLLKRFPRKLKIINPGVLIGTPAPHDVDEFRKLYAPDGTCLIGVAARFAAEKGIEYLLEAFPAIRAALGKAKILFTGNPRTVVGEGNYWARLQPLLASLEGSCVFLGTLDWKQIAVFYAACDVIVLPSTNSTEAFGLVQLESMLCGTPVVASDLPGVRVPVQTTGMGRLAPPRDVQALAKAVVDVVLHRDDYLSSREEVEYHFSYDTMLRDYETLFEMVSDNKR
jgi:glycosyltransferase involved in cell wall biosynthesis